MDIARYRKHTEQQVVRARKQNEKSRAALLRSASTPGSDERAVKMARKESPEQVLMSLATDKTRRATERAKALRSITSAVTKDRGLMASTLALLKDRDEPLLVRNTALQLIQIASFRAVMFAPYRAQYMSALRELLDDPNESLRAQVTEILALQKDEYAHRRLLEGLKDDKKALVPPEKAIQLLGEDIHADHLPLLTNIVRGKKQPVAARREAVRLMAAHPSSRSLLARVLSDKKEDPGVRQASAIALQTLAPKKFEGLAKKIALDARENPALRATSITGLTHFSNPATLYRDADFAKGVQRVSKREGKSALGNAAEKLLRKQPRK